MRTLRRPRAFAALCIAAALFSGGTLVSGFSEKAEAAGAVAPTATTPEPPAQVADALKLTVAPEAPVLTKSDTEARFVVLLQNASDRTLPEGSVELSMGERLTGESALVPVLDAGADTGGARGPHVVATAPVDALAAGKDHRSTITVPLADLPVLTAAAHGVYPIYANYLAGDAATSPSLTATTPLVWEGPGEPNASIDLSLIVPLALPEQVHSMPTRAQLGEIAPRLDRLLEYAARTQATLAIDPRLIAAIRGYGLEAPQAARDFLERLERTQLSSFLLQYGDADPAAQAALSRDTLLQPDGFEFITRFGAWEPTAGSAPLGNEAVTDPVAPADQPDAGTKARDDATTGAEERGSETPEAAPEAPAPETLAEWPNGLAGAWPAPGQADSRTLSLLRKEGLTLTVLRSDNVTLTGGPRATLGTGNAFITDAELDEGVRLALTGTSEAERALGTVRATARLALAAASGSKSLMLGVDRGGIADADRPEELLAELTTRKWIGTVSHTEQAEGTAQLKPASPAEERVELLSQALGNEAVVLETRSILVNPEYLDSYQRMRLLNLLGTRNAAPDIDFSRVARGFSQRDSELHDGVELVGTKRAQLVGGSTRIPIQLRNSLPFDAVVNLTVAPTSAALLVSERSFESVLLPEESIERVLVPTQSRLSSGDSALLLSVTSVDGKYTASESRLEVAISSSVETVAIVLLGGAAALLFGFGIWRSLRRRTLSPRE